MLNHDNAKTLISQLNDDSQLIRKKNGTNKDLDYLENDLEIST